MFHQNISRIVTCCRQTGGRTSEMTSEGTLNPSGCCIDVYTNLMYAISQVLFSFFSNPSLSIRSFVSLLIALIYNCSFIKKVSDPYSIIHVKHLFQVFSLLTFCFFEDIFREFNQCKNESIRFSSHRNRCNLKSWTSNQKVS